MNPAVAPTERSIFPVSMTAVSPVLSISSMLACLNIVIILSKVINSLTIIEEIATTIISPIKL